MRVRSLMSITLMCVLSVVVSAQAVPEVKLPPSPAGQAAIQVGGKWDKTAEGGQTYRDVK